MNNKLDFRYDYPLTKLGKNIEEILPGEIKFHWEDEIVPIIALSDAILDIFEVASGTIDNLYVSQNSLENLRDFLNFKGNKKDNYNYYVPTKRFKNERNIHILKYKFEDKILNIKVFCPIKFEEVEAFRNQWFHRLKLIQNDRSRRNRRS